MSRSSRWASDDISFAQRQGAARKAAKTRQRRAAVKKSIREQTSRMEEAKRRAIEDAERKAAAELADAEEWYAIRRRKEALQAARIAANQRRDHLLPEDDQLPF